MKKIVVLLVTVLAQGCASSGKLDSDRAPASGRTMKAYSSLLVTEPITVTCQGSKIELDPCVFIKEGDRQDGLNWSVQSGTKVQATSLSKLEAFAKVRELQGEKICGAAVVIKKEDSEIILRAGESADVVPATKKIFGFNLKSETKVNCFNN